MKTHIPIKKLLKKELLFLIFLAFIFFGIQSADAYLSGPPAPNNDPLIEPANPAKINGCFSYVGIDSVCTQAGYSWCSNQKCTKDSSVKDLYQSKSQWATKFNCSSCTWPTPPLCATTGNVQISPGNSTVGTGDYDCRNIDWPDCSANTLLAGCNTATKTQSIKCPRRSGAYCVPAETTGCPTGASGCKTFSRNYCTADTWKYGSCTSKLTTPGTQTAEVDVACNDDSQTQSVVLTFLGGNRIHGVNHTAPTRVCNKCVESTNDAALRANTEEYRTCSINSCSTSTKRIDRCTTNIDTCFSAEIKRPSPNDYKDIETTTGCTDCEANLTKITVGATQVTPGGNPDASGNGTGEGVYTSCINPVGSQASQCLDVFSDPSVGDLNERYKLTCNVPSSSTTKDCSVTRHDFYPSCPDCTYQTRTGTGTNACTQVAETACNPKPAAFTGTGTGSQNSSEIDPSADATPAGTECDSSKDICSAWTCDMTDVRSYCYRGSGASPVDTNRACRVCTQDDLYTPDALGDCIDGAYKLQKYTYKDSALSKGNPNCVLPTDCKDERCSNKFGMSKRIYQGCGSGPNQPLPSGNNGATMVYMSEDGNPGTWFGSTFLYHFFGNSGEKRVGIGDGLSTVAPQEMLEIRGSSSQTARVRITDAITNPEFQLQYKLDTDADSKNRWSIYVKQSDKSLNVWTKKPNTTTPAYTNPGDEGHDILTISQDGTVIAKKICFGSTVSATNCAETWPSSGGGGGESLWSKKGGDGSDQNEITYLNGLVKVGSHGLGISGGENNDKFTIFKGSSTQTVDINYVLPATGGNEGDFLKIGTGGVLSWAPESDPRVNIRAQNIIPKFGTSALIESKIIEDFNGNVAIGGTSETTKGVFTISKDAASKSNSDSTPKSQSLFVCMPKDSPDGTVKTTTTVISTMPCSDLQEPNPPASVAP